jgi:hypothetical protein
MMDECEQSRSFGRRAGIITTGLRSAPVALPISELSPWPHRPRKPALRAVAEFAAATPAGLARLLAVESLAAAALSVRTSSTPVSTSTRSADRGDIKV